MSNVGNVGPFGPLPNTAVLAEADTAEPTSEQQQIATEFPAGVVEVERSGAKTGLRIPGAILSIGGAALLGLSLLSRRPPGAIESRVMTSALAIGGGMVGAGALATFGAGLLPPAKKIAVATNIPTQAKAGEIAGKYPGHKMQVVKTTDGTWAVLDQGPSRGYSSSTYGSGHYYGDGHFHGQHYYGDGHNHSQGYYDPYYPGSGDYYPTPSYPSGGTSRGDDYDYSPSYPSSGSGTSRGDDSGSSYSPPAYDPPSYDPPSYDPPSYDYGNSSSNGNPSYDDF